MFTLNKLIKFLLFAIVCLLTLGQLLRLGVENFGTIYPHDLLIGIFIPVIIFKQKNQFLPNILKKINKKILIILLLLGITGTLKTIIYHQPTFLLYFLRLSLYVVFLHSIGFEKSITKALIQKIAIIMPTIIAFIGFALYLVSPDLRSLKALGWDDHYYRLIGTLLDPNFTGIILTTSIIFKLVYWIKIEKYRNWFMCAIGLETLALGLTFSRSSFISLFIGLLVLLLLPLLNHHYPLRSKAVKIFLVFFILLITIQLSPKPGGAGVNLTRTFSVYSRKQHDTNWVRFNTHNPLDWLIGPASTKTNSKQRTNLANNLFFTIFGWAGPITTGLLLALIVQTLKKTLKKDPLMLSFLIAVLVFSQFNNILEPFTFLTIGLIYLGKNTLRLKK